VQKNESDLKRFNLTMVRQLKSAVGSPTNQFIGGCKDIAEAVAILSEKAGRVSNRVKFWKNELDGLALDKHKFSLLHYEADFYRIRRGLRESHAGLSEDWLLIELNDNLPHAIEPYILSDLEQTKTLDQFFNKLRDYDERRRLTKPGDKLPGVYYTLKNDQECFNCGLKGDHLASECPNPKDEKNIQLRLAEYRKNKKKNKATTPAATPATPTPDRWKKADEARKKADEEAKQGKEELQQLRKEMKVLLVRVSEAEKQAELARQETSTQAKELQHELSALMIVDNTVERRPPRVDQSDLPVRLRDNNNGGHYSNPRQ
jgi:hypothetical protein